MFICSSVRYLLSKVASQSDDQIVRKTHVCLSVCLPVCACLSVCMSVCLSNDHSNVRLASLSSEGRSIDRSMRRSVSLYTVGGLLYIS